MCIIAVGFVPEDLRNSFEEISYEHFPFPEGKVDST